MSGRKPATVAILRAPMRFATSSRERGIILEDTKDGVRWKQSSGQQIDR